MTRRLRMLSVAVIGVLGFAVACTPPGPPPTSTSNYACTGTEQDPAGPVQLNQVYGGAAANRADFYPACTAQAVGTIMYVHGGGYTGGTKDDARLVEYQRLRDEGWAIVSINYRLAPQFGWPAQPEDVQLAINWWRSSGAAALDAPVAPLVGMGWSAGGQLAEFNSLNSPNGFDAAVSISGSTYWPDRPTAPATTALFGFNASFGTLEAASSVTHLDAGDPPLLHIHAANDPIVAGSQADILADAIATDGNPAIHTVIIDPTCGHWHGCMTPSRIDPFLASIAGP